MPKGTQLTSCEKGIIDGLKQLKPLSNRNIARLLNRSPQVVNNYITKGQNYCKKLRKGRKPKLSERGRRRIIKYCSNKVISLSKIMSDLCSFLQLNLQFHVLLRWIQIFSIKEKP